MRPGKYCEQLIDANAGKMSASSPPIAVAVANPAFPTHLRKLRREVWPIGEKPIFRNITSKSARGIVWICCEDGDEYGPFIACELLLSDDCEVVFVKQGDGSLGWVQPDEMVR